MGKKSKEEEVRDGVGEVEGEEKISSSKGSGV